MSDEMKLLKAFISASGYNIKTIWRDPSGSLCDPPGIFGSPITAPQGDFIPRIDYEVTPKKQG